MRTQNHPLGLRAFKHLTIINLENQALSLKTESNYFELDIDPRKAEVEKIKLVNNVEGDIYYY